MKPLFSRIALTLLLIAGAIPGLAQTLDKPRTGAFRDDVFLPKFNAICGIGNDQSTGCQAIRARNIVDASQYPWRAIGRVNFASIQIRQHCTGTLIAPRIVLTAAHCLYNYRRKAWIPASSMRFVAGYQRGLGRAVSTVIRYVLDPAHDPKGRDFTGQPEQDWAFLILQDAIGADTGVLPLRPIFLTKLNADELRIAGYAGLRPHVLSVTAPCDLVNHPTRKGVDLLNCPTMPGDSGAPVLVTHDDGLAVVGVLSAVYATPGGPTSLGISASVFQSVFDRLLAQTPQ